jgi:fluoroquinolone transport system permease protein
MKTLTMFRALIPLDIKNIRRDALLLWIPLIPLVMALGMRNGLPPLAQFLRAQVDFDLTAYYTLIMSSFLPMTPTMVGMVIGFLLLDERDDRTLTALMVTPLPPSYYLLYRISLPMLLSFVMTLIGFAIAGLQTMALSDLLLLSALASLSAPLVALFLAGFSENKVAGLAMLKILNGISILPMVAYFFNTPLQIIAGIIPTYWMLKAYWLAAAGQDYKVYFVVGIIAHLLVLGLLLGRFRKVLYR